MQIRDLKIFYSKAIFEQIDPKTKILSYLLEKCTLVNLKVLNTYSIIYCFISKKQMWANWSQLCKMASSNLRKTFLTSKLLSREYRYDVIREFLHSNLNFGKYLSHIQFFLDQHENLLSSYLVSSSFTPSKLDVKSKNFFQEILSPPLSCA